VAGHNTGTFMPARQIEKGDQLFVFRIEPHPRTGDRRRAAARLSSVHRPTAGAVPKLARRCEGTRRRTELTIVCLLGLFPTNWRRTASHRHDLGPSGRNDHLPRNADLMDLMVLIGPRGRIGRFHPAAFWEAFDEGEADQRSE
jgi:hypothetical protein